MMKLSFDFSARVPGGPAFAFSRSAQVQALDRLSADVTRGTPLTLELQPSAATKVVLLGIACTLPASDPGGHVTATIQDGTGAGANKTDALRLDAPIVLAGSALALLPGAPKLVVLDYPGAAAADTATVEILIARTA